ncbi:hypothetical protein GCM10020001_050530 [Nonomuraea salmonea]
MTWLPARRSSKKKPLDLGMLSDSFMSNFGIAVIEGLADDVEVFPSPKGTNIRMSWPAAVGSNTNTGTI